MRFKLLLCLLLAVFAAASLLAVLGSLGVLDRAEPAAQAPMYALRSWQGGVGVFSPPEGREPVTMVTGVLLRDLPLTDRLALLRGVTAPDREALIRLLEDLTA